MNPVGFDNTMLSILLNPASRIPIDPATGHPVTMAKSVPKPWSRPWESRVRGLLFQRLPRRNC